MEVKPLLVISVAMISMGLLFHLVGLSTEAWSVSGNVGYGPWNTDFHKTYEMDNDRVDVASEWVFLIKHELFRAQNVLSYPPTMST